MIKKVTVITELIENINRINSFYEGEEYALSAKIIMRMLNDAKELEKQQILNAFNEGMKYGNSSLQTFDYPASRYYMFTYDIEPKNNE